MDYTLDQIVADARAILQDQDADRYADQRFITAINLALSTMRSARPDITSIRNTIQDFPYTTIDLGMDKVLPLSHQFAPAVVSYVAGWVELADDEFTVDGRAAMLLSNFSASLVT